MIEPVTVCLLGFGEVGQRLADDLRVHDSIALSAFDLKFSQADSAPARRVQEIDYVKAYETAIEAASGSRIIVSAVTAAEDLNAARSIVPALTTGSWFLDLNSVSPATRMAVAQLVDEAGGKYIEGAVMSPIAPLGIAAPILLGGRYATLAEPILKELGFNGVQVFAETIGKASATKMCRSVVIKGFEALLTESMLSARGFGVEQAVLDSLQNMFPVDDWSRMARYMISRGIQHGTRRAEEMREAAATVTEAGVMPVMSLATANRQDQSAKYHSALDHQQLGDMLDHIRGQTMGQQE